VPVFSTQHQLPPRLQLQAGGKGKWGGGGAALRQSHHLLVASYSPACITAPQVWQCSTLRRLRIAAQLPLQAGQFRPARLAALRVLEVAGCCYIPAYFAEALVSMQQVGGQVVGRWTAKCTGGGVSHRKLDGGQKVALLAPSKPGC
jgi:hypothetical protein